MPTRIKPVKRKGTSKGSSYEFTNKEDLKKRFFNNAQERREKKVQNDAGYWTTNGRCNWGGSHNLDEDSESLAKFFNSLANVDEDINEIKLSANETIFNTNKQALISKIQSLISRCQVSNSGSVANVCIIWEDFFNGFLKKYLDRFAQQLKSQLNQVEKLEPKHQIELLQLEKDARKAENDYKENKAKADQETDPDKKAAFMLLANKAAKKAEEIKRKISSNPLTDLNKFSYLNDLTALFDETSSKKSPNKGTPQSPSNTSNQNPNNSVNNHHHLLILTGTALLLIFYFYTQNQENYD